ncbi:MAG: hypothetical protein NTU44_13505 [Bacteroidetes bacterium]|nr:hypothetical protein [Bacteroidota bacterium]
MIPIRVLNDYFDGMLQKQPGFHSFLLVTTEADLGYRVKDLSEEQFPVLIVVVPGTDTIALGADNVITASTCLLYVMQKTDVTNLTQEEFLDTMATCQELLVDLIEQMVMDKFDRNGHCTLMTHLDVNRMHIDPEYNYYGCNGWSLSFTLQTPGF